MDYMCELPNDAARREALGSLPPDLNSTYERILSRVNRSNPETQKLVRRALRWMANDTKHSSLTMKALCEAISIDFGNRTRNLQAIPDEFEILHWCSSLVRKSEDGRKLELAHFTVKEFLRGSYPLRDTSIEVYRSDPGSDKLLLAKVCLTYLNFEDFDQVGPFSQQTIEGRSHEYHFQRYAVDGWFEVARDELGDAELFSLMQKLFNPSKPNTLISWMHEWVGRWLEHFPQVFEDRENVGIIKSGFAEATALHWAAMLGLAKLCDWLIRNGCDVNRNTRFGTPLHCALLTNNAVIGRILNPLRRPFVVLSSAETVELLLEAGADSNCCYDRGTEALSPLFIALHWDRNFSVQLLDRGAILDNSCLEFLEKEIDPEERYETVEHCTNHNLRQENHSRWLRLALRAKTFNATRLMLNDKELPYQNAHYEQALHTAAEFGQVGMVIRLLEDQKLDVDAADEDTGLTALHHAARTDQLEVTKVLVDRGADSSRSDGLGRTALHHSIQGTEFRCLQFFLQRDADTSLQDLEGMTVWHLVAQEGNLLSLRILLSRHVDSASVMGLKANDGRTPLLCASASGSKEAIRLLLSAGSSLTEAASDGSSSLHYAAKAGSVGTIKFLAEQAVHSNAVTNDGSSAIYYAIMGSRKKLAEIVQVLLEIGVDPCKARNDGCTPLYDLVRIIKEILPSSDSSSSNSSFSDELEYLFTASRTLAEKVLETSRLLSDVQLGSELIYLACSQSFPSAHENVLALLEFGLDLNNRFADGKTALMAAAESGNDTILSTLLLHGADPCIDHSGLNAVHCACFNDHKSILILLRETSIDWNSKTTATIMGGRRINVTALHIAAHLEDSRVLEYLLNEDLMSNIDARTGHGETPLSVAVHARAPRNVSLLLSNSADTTTIDSFGYSAIHWAAKDGYEEVVSEFIGQSSDLGLPHSHGLTPELVARKYGHEALAKIIMEYVNETSGSYHSALMDLCALSNSILSQVMNYILPYIVRDQAKPTEHRKY